MLLSLDAAILRVVAVPVRLWCGTTGKSNFALARILLYCAAATEVTFPIALALGGSPTTVAVLMIPFAFFIAAAVLMWQIPRVRAAEKALDEWEGGYLPREMKEFYSEGAFIRRLINIFFFLLALLLASAEPVWFCISGYHFFFAFALYAICCATPGRKKSRVKEFFKRLRFSLPKPRTTPSPHPA